MITSSGRGGLYRTHPQLSAASAEDPFSDDGTSNGDGFLSIAAGHSWSRCQPFVSTSLSVSPTVFHSRVNSSNLEIRKRATIGCCASTSISGARDVVWARHPWRGPPGSLLLFSSKVQPFSGGNSQCLLIRLGGIARAWPIHK